MRRTSSSAGERALRISPGDPKPKRRRRYSLVRIGIVVLIAITALGAFGLQIGIFRFLFRGMLIIGALALFGSYFWGLWFKRARRRRADERPE